MKNGPIGVYKRGEFWWFRAGHSRHSSRSRNIEDAVALRAQAVAAKRTRHVQDEWRRYVTAAQTGSESWLRRTHRRMKRKSVQRGWLDCVSFEEFAYLMLVCNGVCAITGIPFAREDSKRSPFAISIDRIDSSRGYCVGNLRFVLLAVNLGMSHWGENAFRSIARALVGRELVSAGVISGHSRKRRST